MEYVVLIFSLIIINLISWIFVFRFQNKSQNGIDSINKKCNNIDETLKRVEGGILILRSLVEKIKCDLSNLPTKSEFENLKRTFLNKSDSLLTEIKAFVDILTEKYPQVEVTPQEIRNQVLNRLKILEDKIEELQGTSTPVKKAEESKKPPVDEAKTPEKNEHTVESKDLFDFKKKKRFDSLSPHQELINVLIEYDTVPSVKDILNEIETMKSGGISRNLLRNLLDIYKKYYQSEFNNLSTALENILKSKYDVNFNHAQIGIHMSSAVGFERVKDGETFKLDTFESKKIERKRFDQENKDIILFELCPQIQFKNELILKGKIIVS